MKIYRLSNKVRVCTKPKLDTQTTLYCTSSISAFSQNCLLPPGPPISVSGIASTQLLNRNYGSFTHTLGLPKTLLKSFQYSTCHLLVY